MLVRHRFWSSWEAEGMARLLSWRLGVKERSVLVLSLVALMLCLLDRLRSVVSQEGVMGLKQGRSID